MAKEWNKEDEEVIRVRLPKKDEQIGIVQKRLGYCKMYVRCSDGNIRVCRIPGKYRRRLWVRATDIVIVKPWETQSDKRGDVLHKYRKAQVAWLRKHGHMDSLDESF
jgi:translation initiation factor 1A